MTPTSFQRRRETRYQVAFPVVAYVADKAHPVTGTVRNLSRHGGKIELSGQHKGALPNCGIRVQFQLPDSSQAVTEFKTVRAETATDGRTQYGGELLFPEEKSRRRLHTFLRTLGPDMIEDRRRSGRRLTETSHLPERRRVHRRREFGIFSDAVAFANRSSKWKCTYYQPAESRRPGRITVRGKELISFASKDYLGLAHDERMKAAAIEALDRYGTSTGSRVLNGTIPLHYELEREIADFKGTEAALLFTGGYIGNIAILTALLKGKESVVFIDEKVHASIHDGCVASGATPVSFAHNSIDDLEKKVRRHRSSRNLIIVDGVYSIDGNLSNLPPIKELAGRYGIPLLVDDAHGIGVMGKTGAGTTEHFDLRGQVDLDVGSCGAALSSVGGFVACRKDIRDYLLHFSNGVVFTTNLTPVTMACILQALRIIRTDESTRQRLQKNAKNLASGLRGLGYTVSPTESAVMSLLIGNEDAAFTIVERLESRGIYVNPFRRPLVRRGEAKLRLAVSAAHSEEDIAATLDVFLAIRDEVRKLTAVSS